MSRSKIVREVKLFEFYRDHLWPIHRIFVKKFLTPRCQQCFLSQTYSPLEEGVCHDCRTFQDSPSSVQSKVLLNQFNQSVKRNMDHGNEYDAVVLFSGGKDSTYMVKRLRDDFPGIRLLCLMIDNTFMSEIALINAKELIEKLGVEHISYRPPNELMERMYRHAFLNLNDKGCSGTVDQFDGDFLCDIGRNFTLKMKAPMLFIGLSKIQVEKILNTHSYESPKEKEQQNRTEVAGIKLSDIFSKTEITKYFWQGKMVDPKQVPKVFFPFYAWNLGEEKIKKEVAETGLLPKGNQSPLVTNNQLIPLMGLVDMANFGYSSFEPEFAEMVRKGLSDRKHWLYTFELLEYAAKTGRFISGAVDEVIGRLGLTRSILGIKGGARADILEPKEKSSDITTERKRSA